jgi:predicted dehydrogenase
MAALSQFPLRILVAGAGGFGREHLDRLTARSDVKVVGVADPDPAALAHVRQRYGIERFVTDSLQLMNETEAHAIIVATPAASHAEIAVAALERNISVLLEKPVAASAGIAAELISAAQASRAFVLPGHVLRFSKDHAAVVEIILSGQIGNVLCVNSRRYRDDSHAVRYYDTDPVLMTLIHDIDLALWIARSPFRSVRAWRSAGAGFRSITAASATTVSGIRCELCTAWTFTNGELPPDRVEVVGDRGSIELDAGRALHLYSEGRHTQIPASSGDDPLANEHDHFLACVSDRQRQPALDLQDALAGLKLADAILESLRLDREVSVDA